MRLFANPHDTERTSWVVRHTLIVPLLFACRQDVLLFLDHSIAVGLHTPPKGCLRGFLKEALEGIILGVNFLATLGPREFLFGFQFSSRDWQTRATAGQQYHQGWDSEPTDKQRVSTLINAIDLIPFVHGVLSSNFMNVPFLENGRKPRP